MFVLACVTVSFLLPTNWATVPYSSPFLPFLLAASTPCVSAFWAFIAGTTLV